MTQPKKMHKYMKLLVYFVVVVLLNLAGLSLFFRLDLTQNDLYRLADASREVVSNLSEPLTIKVFFTKNLPAPHNNTEQYLHDLLGEYDLYANRHFNYRFYDVSFQEGASDEGTSENQKLAQDYGIYPVQIQVVEQDEMKFTKAYMGMVLINGDLIERIPTITGTDQLEYNITSAIRKLNNKVSALLKLKEKIKIRLYLSSSLKIVAPYIELEQGEALPDKIRTMVETLNANHFGKLDFEYIDPSAKEVSPAELKQYQILNLKWPALDNGKIPPGEASAGLALVYGRKSVTIPLIQVMRLPIIGTRYSLTDLAKLDETIRQSIEGLIDINEDIGYLASHGTLSENPQEMMNMPGAGNEDSIANFKQLVSQNYSFKEVDLKTEPLTDDFNCLIIANPTETFTEEELFQLDQFLMRGNNLAIFVDPFKIMEMDQQNPMMGAQGPIFLPLKSGLEKLLAHYGVSYEPAYVMDKNCYKQRVNPRFGGGERTLYFAPLIENRNIGHDLDFMQSIKGLITMRIAPLSLKQEILDPNAIKAHELFSSSDKAWEMKGRIVLNPDMIHPPINEGDYQKYPLAYLLEGEFPSYFKGKPIPEKKPETKEGEDANKVEKSPTETNLSAIEQEGAFLEKGKPGKILFIASAELLKDNMVDVEGQSPNSVFLLNALDELNGRGDTAVLRGKEQRFNPLSETTAGVKSGVKILNIMGLPVLMILVGMVVWMRRRNRKKQIQLMFQK
ncbi:MAG: hypothetical protein FP816_07760 [Desulfobacteraceae bacterium]|nr:hypothetical protein [Desulfobacteraceae bacterium]